MTRKEFFKKLGIGVAAIVVAPKVIAEASPKGNIVRIPIDPKWDLSRLRALYPLTIRECYPPEEIVRIYRQNGNLIYQMQPYMEDIQMDWFKMEIAMEKERKRIINDLITFGEAKTNML